MAKWQCIKPCWHNRHLYRLGEVYELEESNLPKDKDGKILHFKNLERGPGRPKKDEGPVAIPGGVAVKVTPDSGKERTVKVR